MRILAILTALGLAHFALGAQKITKIIKGPDLTTGDIKKLLEMADQPAPRQTLEAREEHIRVLNETVSERQREVSTSESPIQLTEDNFHDYVIDVDTHELILERPWFILFYAPWCDYCKQFLPTWKEFHEKHRDSINIASIDCSKPNNKVLCMEYNIMAYPTLRLIPYEFPFDKTQPVMHGFNDHRTIEAMEEFALHDGY